MSQVVAIDLDGTLISCGPRHCALMHQVCSGDTTRPDFLARYWADKREGASNVGALRAQGHPAAMSRAQAWAREIEHWPWLGFDSLLPGVARALTACHRPVTVLTARREALFLHQQLDRLGLMRLIDELVVVSPAEATRAKADALARLRPVTFIGDTESDANAACAAGSPFIALHCGMRSAAYWRSRGLQSLPDLTAALAALPA